MKIRTRTHTPEKIASDKKSVSHALIHIAVWLWSFLWWLTLPVIMYSETWNFFISFLVWCITTMIVVLIFGLIYFNSEWHKTKKEQKLRIKKWVNTYQWHSYKNDSNFLNNQNYYKSKKIERLYWWEQFKKTSTSIFVTIILFATYFTLMAVALGGDVFMEELLNISSPIIMTWIFIPIILYFNYKDQEETKYYYRNIVPRFYHKDKNKVFFY